MFLSNNIKDEGRSIQEYVWCKQNLRKLKPFDYLVHCVEHCGGNCLIFKMHRYLIGLIKLKWVNQWKSYNTGKSLSATIHNLNY